MPGSRELSHILNFDGGLNTVDPPSEIKDNQLTVAKNMWYPNSQLAKRPGFIKLTSAPLVTTNKPVFLGFNELSGRYVISTLGEAKLWEATGGGSVTPVTGMGGSVARWVLSISGTTYVGFDSSMGVRTLSSFAISGSTIANSPNSQVAVYHKGRIFSDVFATRRIAFSDPITPTAPVATWQTTSLLDVGVGDDNSNITAIVSLGDLLIIFKARSTWTLYVQGNSPGDWVLRKIANIGAAPGSGNASTFVYDNILYFISNSGVHKTNGSSFTNISKNIWQGQSDKFIFNTAFPFGQHRITRWQNSLIITGYTYPPIFPTTVGYTYVYNLDTDAWTSWEFLGNVAGFEDAFSLDGEYIYTLASDLNMYFSQNTWILPERYDAVLASGTNVYSDGLLATLPGAGTAYNAEFRSKYFTAAPDQYTRVKWAGVEYLAYESPQLKFYRDSGSTISESPGFNSAFRKGYKIPGPGRCRTFALDCVHTATSPFEFNRADLHVISKVPLITSGTP